MLQYMVRERKGYEMGSYKENSGIFQSLILNISHILNVAIVAIEI